MGASPGEEESAGVNRSKRSPKGNRQMRRVLNQAANAAAKHKGSIFEIVYRRLVLRLGHYKTIAAIAHRLCQLVWIILHKGVRYEERGPAVREKSKRARTVRMIRTLRTLGEQVMRVQERWSARVFSPIQHLASQVALATVGAFKGGDQPGGVQLV